MKRILIWKLRLLSRWILRKYQPRVIGVTGSVGKSSTVEAVYTVLRKKFRVRKSYKNYNNEFGLPLSIIGARAGGKNPFAWVGVVCRALRLALFRDGQYPELLVLEMGADQPGDIQYLTSIAPCHIGVFTAVGPAHLELFDSVEKIAREKALVVTHITKNGYAVLNADDQLVMDAADKVRAQVITFGFMDTATVRASELKVSAGPSADPWVDVQIKGLSFKLHYQGSTVPVFLPSVLGRHQVYSGLAAAAVGISLGMNLSDVSTALREYQSPPGRMHLLPGIKHTSLIDDTYNSSPLAANAALAVLKDIQVSGKKIAALGDMLELGSYTQEGHRDVGHHVVESADVLVTVGERAQYIAEGAREAGMNPDRVFHFDDTRQAGKFIQERMQTGDIVLIKGSQGARMERVTRELMAEPLRATELLVRQDSNWR